ncbi:MAG: hypothetical protein QN183_12015 [Armatimonadota bacterium]|nr:hypothetical protein [Armatimonadota bacterium]
MPYPAAGLDPDGRFFPAGPWFHFMRDGRHYFSYPPYFPALAGLLYGGLGYPGLLVIPLAAGVATLLITAWFLGLVAPRLAAVGVVAVGLGTPLLVYSVVFWDHSLVAALGSGALAATALALRDDARSAGRPLAFAGALLGAGLWFRNEMYVLLVAIGAGWLLWGGAARVRGAAVLGTAAGLVALPALVLNVYLFGGPLGWKGRDLTTGRLQGMAEAAGGVQTIGWLADKLGNAYYQLVSPDFYAYNPRAVAVGLAIATALLAGVVLLNLGRRRRSARWLVAGGATVAALVILTVSGRPAVSGLLISAPVVLLSLLGGQRARWERYLWTVVVVFAGAVVVTGTHGGLQWGPRYLLPIVPALVWLAAAATERTRQAVPGLWPPLGVAVCLVLGASVLVQVAGVEHVDASLSRNVRVNAALRAAPAEIVVTGLEWLVLGAGPVYFEKRLLFVQHPELFRLLVRRFVDRRVEQWTYVPWSGSAYGAGTVQAWTATAAWRFSVIDDREVNGIRLVTYHGTSGAPQ